MALDHYFWELILAKLVEQRKVILVQFFVPIWVGLNLSLSHPVIQKPNIAEVLATTHQPFS
jgi:hypothetical protein